jgi:competence protein ComEC
MKTGKYILLALLLATVLLALAVVTRSQADPEIVFLDVGQGDAILIQQGTTQILVDGGPGSLVIEKLGEYMPFWDRTIELVIMSHAHADHYLGLIDVFRRFQVNNFMWSGVEEHAADFSYLMELVAAENCSVLLGAANTDMKMDSVVLDVLYPFSVSDFELAPPENLNNSSLVIKVIGPNLVVMLTGDAETEIEALLVDHNLDLAADILKAGHHGSKTSSSEIFIRAVAPRQAIFCAGADNKFNHPAAAIVARYADLEIPTQTLFATGDVGMAL